MQALPRNFKLGLIEPRDASEAFARKGWLLPTFRWQDAFREDHARGVAVAGILKLDVLQAFADELQATIDAGGDLRSFSQRMQAVLERKGMWGDVEITDPRTGELRTTTFDKRRLKLIFDVNTRQANAAGRWQRIQTNKARQPFILYWTMKDERVRQSHREWHGLVLPVDSTFWVEHYPPNGWGCRCMAFGVSERDIAKYERAGTKIRRDAPEVSYREVKDKHTGRTWYVPRGIDAGFDYNPGARPAAGLAMRELAAGVLDYPTPADGLAPIAAVRRLPVPRAVNSDMLMPAGLADEDYLAAFTSAFGNAASFTDVTGQRLVIDEEFFKGIDGRIKISKRGRERFVKLIALAIQQPDEIWMLQARHMARGVDVVRRRYIARFMIEGETKPILAVLELGKDGWVGKSGYQAQADGDVADVLAGARVGELVYARIK